jgi:hypothetical protein
MLVKNEKIPRKQRREKMKNNIKRERRQHPRIDKELPINIVANGYDFVTTTQNVSCLGAYCHIDKYIPPFTKIKIRLDMPIMNKGLKEHCNVECTGVIVRTEDEDNGGFNIAIFFNKIKDQPRQTISRYVSQFLP